ncbi:MAG: DUF6691 family protein [Rubrivivax sp.]
MRDVFSLASGLIFGLGLILGGMSDPAKVKAFLDLFGNWDPSLAFVMGGAIAVGVFAFAAGKKRTASWTGERMEIPNSKVIDTRLIVGGVLFGTGWGIGGFCPGPALVALGSGLLPAVAFVVAMLVGMVVHDRFLAKR